MRRSFGDEIKQLTERVKAVERECGGNGENRHTNIIESNLVVRNMPAHPVENVIRKVNTMIKDGLQINNITVVSAERKTSQNGKPGVIIAKCNSREEVTTLITKKKVLRDSEKYHTVYLSRDVPYAERVHNQNMRTIIQAIGKNQLEMRGAYVTPVNKNRSNNSANITRNNDHSATGAESSRNQSQSANAANRQNVRRDNAGGSGNTDRQPGSNGNYGGGRSNTRGRGRGFGRGGRR